MRSSGRWRNASTWRWSGRSDLRRRTAIEARIEAFNAFNWFVPGLLNAPVVNRNNVQFGRITSADDPRIMQFAVKYSF
jgi:hypothetical protein